MACVELVARVCELRGDRDLSAASTRRFRSFTKLFSFVVRQGSVQSLSHGFEDVFRFGAGSPMPNGLHPRPISFGAHPEHRKREPQDHVSTVKHCGTKTLNVGECIRHAKPIQEHPSTEEPCDPTDSPMLAMTCFMISQKAKICNERKIHHYTKPKMCRTRNYRRRKRKTRTNGKPGDREARRSDSKAAETQMALQTWKAPRRRTASKNEATMGALEASTRIKHSKILRRRT